MKNTKKTTPMKTKKIDFEPDIIIRKARNGKSIEVISSKDTIEEVVNAICLNTLDKKIKFTRG